MRILDDINQLAVNLARGDLGSALGDVNRTLHDVLNPGKPSTSGYTLVPPTIPSGSAPHEGGSCSGVVVPPPVSSAALTPACCDRFRFDSGFLVDGATGSVWQYDQRAKSFEEVPVNHGKTKQSLIDSLVENRMSELKSQYESEVLSTTAPALRAKKLAAFDKEYLTPLRDAARTLRY
jgi:hypothetical protein